MQSVCLRASGNLSTKYKYLHLQVSKNIILWSAYLPLRIAFMCFLPPSMMYMFAHLCAFIKSWRECWVITMLMCSCFVQEEMLFCGWHKVRGSRGRREEWRAMHRNCVFQAEILRAPGPRAAKESRNCIRSSINFTFHISHTRNESELKIKIPLCKNNGMFLFFFKQNEQYEGQLLKWIFKKFFSQMNIFQNLGLLLSESK